MITLPLVTPEQVAEDCAELGIPDWYRDYPEDATPVEITEDCVKAIMAQLQITEEDIPVNILLVGLLIELEHGCENPDTNVTNNHPLVTATIVMAHHSEYEGYYPKLVVMERELKLHKPIQQLQEAIKEYDMDDIRECIEHFKEVDEEQSLSATEIAIAKLLL